MKVILTRKPLSMDPGNPGLCATCVHSRKVETTRGTAYWMCELSKSDPRFPKYPRLPVARCEGYRAVA
ncbi:MAG: hypothetical protein QXO51_03875 [Halobacteria archaeon]